MSIINNDRVVCKLLAERGITYHLYNADDRLWFVVAVHHDKPAEIINRFSLINDMWWL